MKIILFFPPKRFIREHLSGALGTTISLNVIELLNKIPARFANHLRESSGMQSTVQRLLYTGNRV